MARPQKTEPYQGTPQGRRLFEARRLIFENESQEFFAARCGFERLSYRAIEAGKHLPSSMDVVRALAGRYGVTLDTMAAYIDGALPLAEFEKARAIGENSHELAQLSIAWARLGLHGELLQALAFDSSEGQAMRELSETVRKAVIAAVHLFGYPLEQVVPAAQKAFEKKPKAARPHMTPANWLSDIEQELRGAAESGHFPSVNVKATQHIGE